jgi:hypothetical protein
MENKSRPLIPVDTTGLDDVASALLESSLRGRESEVQEQGQPGNIPTVINRADYIKVPRKGILISKRELYKGKQFRYNWEKSIFILQENGLYMPSPEIFMTHFMNVKQAAEGKTNLEDGNGNRLSRDEAGSLWSYLSSTNRNQFNGEICWTWLDALFKKDKSGKMYMETDHRAVKQGSKLILQGRDATLASHLSQDTWAELSFTPQGLANKVSQQTSYAQGTNIYFWQPVDNRVAGFGAGSGGAVLFCGRNPTSSGSSLGVFACAGGAVPKKT